MSLKDADLLTPQIKLSTIINNLAPSHVQTNRLIITSPEYMKTLATLLSSTSKEVIQTYFIWKVLQSFATLVEAEEIKPYTRFINELQGIVRNEAAYPFVPYKY